MLPLLKVAWMGVGIRPLLFTVPELKADGWSLGGRMKLLLKEPNAGDSGGWLRTSLSLSSSMSMSSSILLDSLEMTGPPYIELGESSPPWSDCAGVMARMSVINLGGEGVYEGR